MQPKAQRAGPVSLTERIQFIDVLRGMALFGILAANMRAFVAPLDTYDNIQVLFHSRADIAAQFLIDFLFQGKFISIFSFLFGMGFAIQLSRAEARGVKFLSFYPRRLLALALFGLIHGILIWAGDILLTYALTGAILLLFRNRQQKTLLWWAGSLFALPIVVGSTLLALYYTRFRPHFMNPKPADMTKIYAIIQVYAHGTVRQILAQNWVEWRGFLVAQLFAIYAVGLFLLGMWVWRSGIVQRLDEYRPVFQRVCAWCLPIGLVLNFFGAYENAVVPDGKFTFALAVSSILALSRRAHSGGRLHFGPGADISECEFAAVRAAVCGGRADGADRLLDAVRAVHAVLLSLHDRAVRARRAGHGAGPDGGPLLRAGRVQQLVAEGTIASGRWNGSGAD